MEMALSMGMFEELDQNEMMEANGGRFVGGIAAGMVIDGVIIAVTGKSAGQWVATGIHAVGNWLWPSLP